MSDAPQEEPLPAPVLGPDASAVDFDSMTQLPEPGWDMPRTITFSPDGRIITFLKGESGSDELALHAYDLATGAVSVLVRAADLVAQQKPLSREEELRRERQRQRLRGITHYQFARSTGALLLPFAGALFLRTESGAIRQLTDGTASCLDPKISHDASQVAFVRGSAIVVMDVATGRETSFGADLPSLVTYGQSDYIAQEEFGEESGFFWAPSGTHIAFLEVDLRHVATQPVMGFRRSIAEEKLGEVRHVEPDLMAQRYPRAGAANAQVRVGVLDLRAGAVTWIAPLPDAEYLGRFEWSSDGKSLWFQALTRDQQTLRVVRADVATGSVREVWAERSTTWVEFAEVRMLDAKDMAVATTTHEGHRHLELRRLSSGERIRLLTEGAWDVESIAQVDTTPGVVHFLANKASPIERHLYRVPIAGGDASLITPERGVHGVAVARDGRTFIDQHSAADRPPRTVICDADGKVTGELPGPAGDAFAGLSLRIPEHITIDVPDGPTLYGAVLTPRNLVPGRRYPAVVMVYGGPGVQMVQDAWAPRLLWQHLADRGFVVFQLDNRGSAGRGPSFQAPIYRRLGQVELEDQLRGLDALVAMPCVDPSRVAIYGHSYGGFMAAMALLRAPGRFKVGIAGSPVTTFRLYDTGYTERYMGTPENNPEGYDGTDLARDAAKLKGKLLIVHALMDENVHFTHTAHLTEALVAAGRPFDMFVFPGERHGYRDPSARRYAMERVVSYLVEHL